MSRRPLRSPFGWLVLTALLASNAVPVAGQPSPQAPDEPGPTCGAETHLEIQLAADPTLAARRAALEALVQQAQAKGLVPTPTASSNVVYTIPVVVHVVHNGGIENISYQQILSQIAAVNRDLQNMPGNAPPATDCQIQLCLATIPQQGMQWTNASEPGVTRTQSAQSIVQISNDVALKAINYMPSDKYLNIWVVKRIDNGSQQGMILGYATFPGTVQPTLDGIVMDYRAMGANPGCCGVNFGTFPTLLASNDQGKVFSHEVGHWLDIYHTFHGGCQIGDQVADTPWEANNFWGCPTGTPTTVCNNTTYPAPIHNFMDYTNDGCRWEFTPGQKARMWAAITTYSLRSKLVTAANLVATGACAPTIFASISLGATQICTNTAVPCSTNPCSGCTYTWGGTGTFANPNAASTTVTFATPGQHTVTLTVSDGTTTSNNSMTVYTTACTPISGTCTNWVWTTRAALTFASGMPVAVSGRLNQALETAAQVSDANGNLAFYTDDNKMWTASNTLMPTFAGSTTLIGGPSAHNGALVLPVPGSSTKYFVFQVREWEDGLKTDPLHYSVVDMTLNGGLGDVVGGQLNLNIPLPGTPQRLIEGMTLIPHCNGTDWWLVTSGAGEDASSTNNWTQFIYVTPITAAGPGVSTVYNNGIGGQGTNFSAWGALTASRDGSRLAIIQSKSQSIGLYSFNRTNGAPTLIYNTGPVDANHDCAFSPNGQILYYTYLKPGTTNEYGLRQYNTGTQQVRTITTPQTPGGDLDPRLGPDGKVYVAPSSSTSLHCINFPDQFNTLNNNECGFNPYSIPLPIGATTTFYATMPNLLPVCSASAPAASFTYKQTNCTTVQFTTPICGPWTWNFGDNSATSSLQNPSHVYAPGTYTVTLTAPNSSNGSVQQTITIGNQPISIAGPSMACGGPFIYTAVGPSNYNYSWTIVGGSPTSATGITVLVSWGLQPGSMTLTATDPATGCVSTAFMGVEICNQCTPPPLDMVAWWPLDEGSGTVAQDIVAGNDGAEPSANSPAKVVGAVLNAGQFDGSSSIVRVPNAPKLDLGTGDLTLDAWTQTSSIAPLQGILEKRLLSPKRGYALYLKQGKLALELGDGSTIVEYWASNASSIADGQWHHVAATEDRGNTTSGTQLYVDGAVVATFAGYASGASLANTEKLVIGAEEPAAVPTNWFTGKIDEVEIFKRALAPSEIQKIWGAGPAGKCKEIVTVQKNQMFCASDATALVYVKLCNLGTTIQNFNLSFGAASGCTGPSPTTFVMQQNYSNPISVPPGSFNCVTVPVLITKPGGLQSGQTSCWKVTATNNSSGIQHVSKGSLWANNLGCVIVTGGGWGNTTHAGFAKWTLTNTSPTPLLTQGLVMVEPQDDDEPLPPLSVSLNGLPPGSPYFTSTFVLAPGDSTSISVDASFTLDRPFHHYDLSFYADLNDDGQFDLGSSTDLGYDERPATVLAVKPPAVPTELRLAAPVPNPFRHETTLEFQLPQVSWVKLSLFDLMGRRVRSLADGLFEPGRHTLALQASGLASGLYFVRLESRGEVRSQRVVLLHE